MSVSDDKLKYEVCKANLLRKQSKLNEFTGWLNINMSLMHKFQAVRFWSEKCKVAVNYGDGWGFT